MELTKESILETFAEGIKECRSVAKEPTHGWVCCDEKDSLPIRKDDKGALHFFGGKIFVANSAHYAGSVAATLNSKAAGTSVHLVVLPAKVWAERRIAVLEGIVKNLHEKM